MLYTRNCGHIQSNIFTYSMSLKQHKDLPPEKESLGCFEFRRNLYHDIWMERLKMHRHVDFCFPISVLNRLCVLHGDSCLL